VATDFSEPSRTALAYGRELAARLDPTLHLVHVVEETDTAGGAEAHVSGAPDLQMQIEACAWRRLKRAAAEGTPRLPTVLAILTSRRRGVDGNAP
jgi:nucleotide-binding universal stress UspA family protein